jgi:hypothetical protein
LNGKRDQQARLMRVVLPLALISLMLLVGLVQWIGA